MDKNTSQDECPGKSLLVTEVREIQEGKWADVLDQGETNALIIFVFEGVTLSHAVGRTRSPYSPSEGHLATCIKIRNMHSFRPENFTLRDLSWADTQT